MNDATHNPVIEKVRRSLGRKPGDRLATRPPTVSPRLGALLNEELDLLLSEIKKISGVTQRVSLAGIDAALDTLLHEQDVKKAALWRTPGLEALEIEARLRTRGVEIISPYADKQTLGQCDLGVTEVNFALPETGTIALLSSRDMPRAVSLVPRIHLAVLRPSALCADLHHLFIEAKAHNYMIFITGPSRTADIELTVTLGVHGPKALYVWALT
jgi:L-lactate dehydrogenase complex protein LldG